MKIPHEVVGRTKPSGEGLGYFRDSSEQAFGPWRQAVGALAGLGAQIEQRQNRDQNFDAIMKFNEFEADYAEKETELRRAVSPNDASYLQRSEALFDNLSSKFISSLPPALQKEYQARTSEIKSRALGNSLKFEYEQKDGWYRQGISESFNKSRTALDSDPTPETLDAEIARTNEAIDASNLSEGEKQSLKVSTSEQLLLDAYRAASLKNGGEFGTAPAEDKPLKEGDRVAKVSPDADALISAAKELGINPADLATAISYETGGKFSTSIRGGKGGNYLGLIQFGPEERAKYGVRAGQSFAEQMQAVKAFLKDRGVKPGMGLLDIYSTINAGSPGRYSASDGPGQTVAGHVAGMDAHKKRAEAFLGGKFRASSIDDNPRFAGIPLEKRLAVQEDVQRQLNAEWAATEAQRKAQQDAFDESMKAGAIQGKVGMADAMTALDQGKIDSTTYRQIESILNEKNAETQKYSEAISAMNGGQALTEAQQSTVFKVEEGAAKLAAMDEPYTQTVLTRAKDQSDVPTGVVSQLGMMMKGDDPVRAKYAYDTLDRLSQASLAAFDRRVDDETKKNVAAYQVLRRTRADAEVIEMLSGGKTLEEKQARIRFKEDAKKEYSSEAFGYQSATNSLANWGTDKLPTVSGAEGAYYAWYQTNWEEFFIKANGDKELATQMTDEYAKSHWTLSEIGGRGYKLMINAPEKSGLPMYENDFVWIDEQIRTKANIPDDGTFEVIPDSVTDKEIRDYKAGKGPPPTWVVIRFDSQGIGHKVEQRVQVTPDPELAQRDTDLYKLTRLEDTYREFMKNTYWPEVTQADAARAMGDSTVKPDPNVEKAKQIYEEAISAEYKRLAPRKKEKPFVSPSVDVMGNPNGN